jgi:hypothetical protein
MVNNQLKNLYKKMKSLWLGEKTHLKKKKVSTGLCRVALFTGQPGFSGFLLIPVFCLTCTGPAIESTVSQSTCRVGPSLISMLVGKILNIFISYD